LPGVEVVNYCWLSHFRRIE